MQVTRVKSFKKIGIRSTLDFEVKSKYHNFYADGLVTSNSHAISYGYVTAYTAWLKCKYPLQFFTAALNNAENEAEPVAEIKAIQGELMYFGIKLLPPSLRKSGKKFAIEGTDIRFPLSNIKGISDKALSHLESFRTENANKFEMFMSAKASGVPINILSSLILVGAMDEVISSSRTKLVMEACLWGKLTDKEKKEALNLGSKYNYDLISLVRAMNEVEKDIKGKSIIKDSRIATIRKHFAPYNEIYKKNSKNESLSTFFFEKTLLGYSYTTNLYELYKTKCSDLNKIGEIKGALNDEYFKIIGEVTEAKEATSKKGSKYVSIMLSGHDGVVKCMLFDGKGGKLNECVELNGRLPKEGDITIIRGRRKDEDTIFADNVSIQDIEVLLRISQLK